MFPGNGKKLEGCFPPKNRALASCPEEISHLLTLRVGWTVHLPGDGWNTKASPPLCPDKCSPDKGTGMGRYQMWRAVSSAHFALFIIWEGFYTIWHLVLKLCQPSPQGHNQLCFTQACPHLVCECAPRLNEGSRASCLLLPSRSLQVISFLPDPGGSLSVRPLAWWILTAFLNLTLSNRVSLGFVVSCAPSSQGFLWISCFIDFVSM